jgi:DNA-binding HxlR family transcriptional regulator
VVYDVGMVTKRSYHDACGMARALDVVGERWALHVVRELLLGPKRFTDLRAGLPEISTRVLTERLEELTAAAVITRHRLAPPAGSWVYELTDWGHELGIVVDQIGRWGARSPFGDPDATMSADALALSMRNMFRPENASGVHGTYWVRVGEDHYTVTVDDGAIDLRRGDIGTPQFVLSGSVDAIAELIYLGSDVDAAAAHGSVEIEGDPADVAAYTRLFGLPEPAPTG